MLVELAMYDGRPMSFDAAVPIILFADVVFPDEYTMLRINGAEFKIYGEYRVVRAQIEAARGPEIVGEIRERGSPPPPPILDPDKLHVTTCGDTLLVKDNGDVVGWWDEKNTWHEAQAGRYEQR